MNKHFTHLHLHTDYSLLDGAITIDKLIDFAKKNEFKSLAITDHGNIFGAVKFFQQAKKAGIKPVLGMEAYFTEDIKIKDPNKKYNHLIILVQNAEGYRNLCKLIAYSYQEGFYFKPRIDYKMLEKHSAGLIITSACLGGPIPSLLMENNYTEADKKIDWFLDVFGKERFYLEVQPPDLEDQRSLNVKLFDIAEKRGISTVATGDCHYIYKEDHEAHEIMLCVQTHHKITDAGRFTFGGYRAYIRTLPEMLDLFKGHEDSIWNSGKIADMCDFSFRTDKLFFPKFEIPDTFTQEQYFSKLCTEGLNVLIENQRIDNDQLQIYRDRLTLETDLIINMGFVGYFLVVSDFIKWAKTQDIPVGPGRGSAAGSLVAWALEITDIDPIKYNLLFERFLNPERVSMPDIDIDFCIEGREHVIDYVKKKYGHDKVCQIITFGTMMAKGVIKDVARVLGIPFEDSNSITDLISDQLKITLNQAIEHEPKLKQLIDNNPKIGHLFSIAQKLEGITRHASKHAAGVVISPEPISEVLPVYIPPKTSDLVTQYAMTELESLGFLKMDFLGLKNLTLIKKAIALIKKNHTISIDLTKIPLDDLKTYQLVSRGETSGVFQLESDGIKDVLKRLQPAVFEDIIAVNALYRPGPLGSGMVDDFIERKHGRQKIVYLFDELEPILNETYGVIVYQEQVIKIASTIAGYSLGEADILRRAMGKKKADVMAEQRNIFVEKSVERNFNEKKAGELFDLMAYFAGYGFNKSHSAAYALIAYQTAYLKANYFAEFMACLISLEAGDAEKMSTYLQEAKDFNVKVLIPSINLSEIDFKVEDANLRFGLKGIKNVGAAALEDMIAERQKEPFKDLFNFCSRVDLRTCNKRVIESLIFAGAFDELPGNRAQKIEELAKIIDLALLKKKSERTGQMDLFNATKDPDKPKDDIFVFQPLEELANTIKLEKEKEVIGLYISTHPLEEFKKHINWLDAKKFNDLENDQDVICIGMIKNYKTITTKKGDQMAFVLMEDNTVKAEIIIFPKLFAQISDWINKYKTFIVKGVTDSLGAQLKIKAQLFIPIDLLFNMPIQRLTLNLPENLDETILVKLKETFRPGNTILEFELLDQNRKIKFESKSKIETSTTLIALLEIHNIGIKISL